MDNVSSIASPQDDGAGEKLVDEKNGHNSKGIEVKYVTPTSHNGDAKIDIENLKSAFAGMGKEELMKFANDPFWVRTRWFLFILFWLLWIAMLAGAIAIIVLAPKCAPPTPREWWEQSPIYKADVATFAKESANIQGELKGFTTKLDYLKKLGVKSVVLSNILKVGDKESDGKDEFKTIAPSFGTMDDFKAFIAVAKEKGLELLLTLVPNHSSLKNNFFNESLTKGSKYSSYYVWAPAKGFDAEGKRAPPNNWLSQNGGSAWEWSEEREEFYLHQFDKDEPEFNFHNPEVVKYFNEVMQYWLDLGVKGFYLERTPYLLEDETLANETRRRDIGSFDHTQYGYYDHSHTKNLPQLTPLLRGWKALVANHSGILLVDDAVSDRTVAHLTLLTQTLPPYPQLSATDVQDLVNLTLSANSWPVWQVKVANEPEGSQISQALLLTTMLLPGVPVTVAGQELGLEDLQHVPSDKLDILDSPDQEANRELNKNLLHVLDAYKLLVKERASASILHGSYKLHVFNGTSVFAYTRLKSGSPGYLVVLNVGDEETSVDARLLSSVPEDLTPIVSSDLYSELEDKSKSATVTLPGRTVAVYSFVPKAKE